MLQFKLIKTVAEQERIIKDCDNKDTRKKQLAYSTKVVLDLVESWTNLKIQRIFFGDSAFASLKTCHVMKEKIFDFMVTNKANKPQPQACTTYYTGNSKIDEHNCTHQDTFQLERKIKVKDWELQVNHGRYHWFE